ncbi:hypothetical protein RA086_01320 [Lactiplantibacillus sp. WILCCON 0030]|uniref:Integral membrane protein n=1 Tax=Lactiplantibacillus brownii TaxID=3069269 RepID=A0ABU1A5Q2_9LACO|nr:hypothetical protein [Lactiplantibacillus brownii]MDQ7936291.1 hypothetical protein [Lactiplantibacillus brownii]
MKKTFVWTLSNLFATLLLVLGLGLLIVALIISFGSRLGIEATVTALVLMLAGLVYLHPVPFKILVPMIGIISLGAGYATYFSAQQSWLASILAVLIVAAIISYGFSLRRTMKRRHSQWF